MTASEEYSPAKDTEDFLDRQSGSFFRKVDWAAFWVSFLSVLAIYVYTLAPTVTLEDSGELVVAADYLGVPHPPGYPIWTLLSWLFQWVFHWVTYYGQPNPAWSVGLFSAVSGALACGVLGLLVSRSGMDLIRSMPNATEVLGRKAETTACWIGGVTSGLLLALSQGMWSQSVIVEVYSLNVFFEILILLLTYRWMCRPRENHTLYLIAFVFGLGLTNHQTLMFVALALMAAIWFRDRPLFRDCLAGLFIFIAALLFWKAFQINTSTNADFLRKKNLMITFGFLFFVSPMGLFLIEKKLMTEWKRVLLVILLGILGLSFYAYMPVASEQNPPMNWGYPRTMEGFQHAISRGQYERVTLSNIFGNPALFAEQVGTYIRDLRSQYTLPIVLLGLIPFFFLHKIDRKGRTWLLTTLWAFLTLSVVLIIFLNPKLDIQTLFIQRVQLIQSHAVYAIWLGYGLIFGLTFVERLLGRRGAIQILGVVLVALLPLVLVWKNAYAKNQIVTVGGSEQNGHDFGWQFGHWQLRGANAIKAELKSTETPLPNPHYPLEMGTNAVFFGGTDPGRFVPTYMIYSANVRPDIYLITQNALADNTYMNVMRDLYGDQIWIPSQADSNSAFKEYVDDVRSGRITAGAELSFEGGRVSVQGVGGVMIINGILAKAIFEHNKWNHDFYVEESYVIPWMYPYLTPHGLIMKINKDPVAYGQDSDYVKNDRAFWDWYVNRLMSNPKFIRDVVARKTFSKLRSAIAGLHGARRIYKEAEYAFRQALELYPLSPEANFRLADLFMQQRDFKSAVDIISEFLTRDTGNDKVRSYLGQISETMKTDERRIELEEALSRGGNVTTAMELARIYRKLSMMSQFELLTKQLLNNKQLPPQIYMQIAQVYAQANRNDLLVVALQKVLEKRPGNPRIWIDLTAAYTALGNMPEALASMTKAVEIGGEPVRDIIRKDRRFDRLRNEPTYKNIVPPIQKGIPVNLR